MTFEKLHPDIIEQLPTCEFYCSRTVTGRIIEAWRKDTTTGKWLDVTLAEQEREAAERALEAAKRELRRATT